MAAHLLGLPTWPSGKIWEAYGFEFGRCKEEIQ